MGVGEFVVLGFQFLVGGVSFGKIDPNPPIQKQAVEETKAVFAPLRERLDAAVEKVEGMLVSFLFSASFDF